MLSQVWPTFKLFMRPSLSALMGETSSPLGKGRCHMDCIQHAPWCGSDSSPAIHCCSAAV